MWKPRKPEHRLAANRSGLRGAERDFLCPVDRIPMVGSAPCIPQALGAAIFGRPKSTQLPITEDLGGIVGRLETSDVLHLKDLRSRECGKFVTNRHFSLMIR
jgi:hypothetical protein